MSETRGEVGVLNVGAGDTKLSFDKRNPAEALRAARIVRDMIRRGYALLVEVEQPDGTKRFQRAEDFIPETAEYIIADLAPEYAAPGTAAPNVEVEADEQQAGEAETGGEATPDPASEPPARQRGRPRKTFRAVKADSTRAVAVARTAGG